MQEAPQEEFYIYNYYLIILNFDMQQIYVPGEPQVIYHSSRFLYTQKTLDDQSRVSDLFPFPRINIL
jgi:hypothetical protein